MRFAPETSYGGDTDTFVTQLNAAGDALVYSTYLGGGSEDVGNGIAVDPNGNFYVTGSTGGDFPIANAYDATHNGFNNVFVTRFNCVANCPIIVIPVDGGGNITPGSSGGTNPGTGDADPAGGNNTSVPHVIRPSGPGERHALNGSATRFESSGRRVIFPAGDGSAVVDASDLSSLPVEGTLISGSNVLSNSAFFLEGLTTHVFQPNGNGEETEVQSLPAGEMLMVSFDIPGGFDSASGQGEGGGQLVILY